MNKINLRIEHDEDAESPRVMGDNFGTMVCFHRRYDLGDKHNFESPQEVMAHIEKTNAVALPLYLYDHSGLTMRTSAFSCPWDSGQVGVIFVEREKIEKEQLGNKPEAVLSHLKSEVETYDQYLQGDVWGFVVETADGEQLDSCWGFFGKDYCEQEGKDSLKHYQEIENKNFGVGE